jgi:hypothetical protein
MSKLDRRQALIGMSTLIGTTLLSPMAVAQSRRNGSSGPAVRVIVEKSETLRGLEGSRLRDALLRLVRIRVEGVTEAVPVAAGGGARGTHHALRVPAGPSPHLFARG